MIMPDATYDAQGPNLQQNYIINLFHFYRYPSYQNQGVEDPLFAFGDSKRMIKFGH